MTVLTAEWTSGGEPVVVTTEVNDGDDFEAKLAQHVAAVRAARQAHPPDAP